MPSTTIHIPETLLATVDSRARAQGISRNRFILQALEHALEEEGSWSSGFCDRLRQPLPEGSARAVDEMVERIVRARTRKSALEL